MAIAVRRALLVAVGLVFALVAGLAEAVALSRARWRLARYH